MRGLLTATLALIILSPVGASATTAGYLEAIELAKAEKYSEAGELFSRQETVFRDNPVYLNRTRVWMALSLLASDEESVEARTKLIEVLCKTLTPEERSQLDLDGPTAACEASNGSSSEPLSQLDADMTTAALATLGTLEWRASNYLSALQLLALASERAAGVASDVSDLEAARQSLGESPARTAQEAAAKAAVEKEVASREIFKEALRKGGRPTREQLRGSPEMQRLIEAQEAASMANARRRIAKGLPREVREDLSLSLEDLARLSAQQQGLEQLLRSTCQYPEMGRAMAQRSLEGLFEGGKQSSYSEKLRSLFQRVATEGVVDCTDAALEEQWGIAPQRTAEEQNAAWQAEREAERKVRENQRRLARLAADEPGRFYRLSSRVVCAYSRTELTGMEDVERSTRQSLAAFLESGRGQVFESYRIVNRGVLAAINRFLDQSEPLRQMSEQLDLAGGQRRPFVRRLAYCADALKLGERFTEALNTLLIKRPFTVESHLREVIETDRRLRDSKQFDDPMRGLQDSLEPAVLGQFYLRAGNAEKALPELLRAFDQMTPSPLSETSPEVAYSTYMRLIAFLRDAIIASRETGQSTKAIRPRLAQLRKGMDEAHSRMEMANPLPLDTDDSARADRAPDRGSSTPGSPDITALLSVLEAALNSGSSEDTPDSEQPGTESPVDSCWQP